jgi:O-antigen/teichoic acid export membrane protein
MTGQVRSFIVSIILARLLLPEDFGIIGMAMVFAAIADSFVDFGFGNAIIQKKDVSQVQKSTVFYINMALGVLLTLIMYLLAPLVALYFEMPLLEQVAKVMSITFVVKGLSALQNALFRKELDYKTPFKVELISSIISSVAGITLAYLGYGVWSLVASQMIGWVISTVMIWIFSNWRPSLSFSLKEVKVLWSFGYKYSLTVFIDMLFSRMDTIVIGKLFEASVLGLFYKAKSLNRMVGQYAFSAFSGVLFPTFSKLGNDKVRMTEALKKVLHIVSFTTFLFSGLMVVSAKEIIVILYSDKWLAAADIFRFIGLFTFISIFPSVLNAPLLGLGLSGKLLKIEMWKKAIYALAIPMGIYFGLYGYLGGTIVASIIGMSFNLVLIKKYLSFSVASQMLLFAKYVMPFIFLMFLFAWVDGYLSPLNSYACIVLKSTAYLSLYCIYHYLVVSEGIMLLKGIITEHLPEKFAKHS